MIRNFVAGSACSSPAVCSSRLCADSGAVTSALVPWNSGGAFKGAAPGVPTPAHGPIAVFDYAGPGWPGADKGPPPVSSQQPRHTGA
ncbi:hypothetical protein ACFV0B_18855 [Streptomyces xanthophaeus]|uniref:hypothetical protein n=1 Tax=Streptomyces xanthophaeus TaxID=67385 RepID=UPI003677BD1A